MDVTQINIKINQTKKSNEEKSNSTKQTEAPPTSFDQILAMFNNLDQSTDSEGKSATSSLKTVSGKVDSEQTKPTKLSAEDWSNLDSILTALDAAIQQVQISPSTLQPTPENLSSASNLTDQPVVSTTFNQHQQAIAEGSKQLTLWLQKVEGLNQTSTSSESSSVLQGLTELIGELQSPEKQKSFDVPKNIGEKIQIIMNELKTENKLGVITLFNTQSNKKPNLSLESKIGLSLDKNQAVFSLLPELGKRIGVGSSLAHAASSPQVEDQTKSSGMAIMANHQSQGPNGWNKSNIETLPPNLTVSEFAPEVSEWIGRYMRINNGESGSTEAKFSLYPEHLGHIEIKITSQQGQVAAQIVTDTSLAKEALEGQLQHLRQALQQHGLLVQKLDIVQQTPVSMDLNQANLSFSQGDSGSSHQQRIFILEQAETKKQEEANQKEIEKETFSYGGAAPMKVTSIDFTA